MDMTVIQIGVVVVAELRSAGYMESTIAQYAKTIRALIWIKLMPMFTAVDPVMPR